MYRTHYECEDSWYSCPASEGGCARDDYDTECDCWADEHNALVDAYTDDLERRLGEAEALAANNLRLIRIQQEEFDEGIAESNRERDGLREQLREMEESMLTWRRDATAYHIKAEESSRFCSRATLEGYLELRLADRTRLRTLRTNQRPSPGPMGVKKGEIDG